MKYKIAILGSAVEESAISRRKAKELGEVLSQYSQQIILLNGVCPGMPDQVIRGAKKKNHIEVWGYSASINEVEQLKDHPEVNLADFSKLIYLSPDFEFIKDINVCRKYRNVFLTANCDAGIIVSGRWGTLNEFTNLIDMGKVIGVLTGTGGAADELPNLTKKISKPNKAHVIFDPNPQVLVSHILQALKKRQYNV